MHMTAMKSDLKALQATHPKLYERVIAAGLGPR